MACLILGIVILLLTFLLPVPYALYVIGIVVGALFTIYGAWIVVTSYPRGPRPRV